MENLLTSLFSYRVKRFAMIAAVLAFTVDMILMQVENKLINDYLNHVFLQYGVLISLLTAVLSKDKVDDELSMQVRYGILKNTLSIIVVMFGIIALFLSRTSVTSISTLTIMFCLEALLVIHLVLYYLGIRYHPKWLLSENTAPKHFNTMTVVMLIFYLVMVAVIILLGLLE